MRPEMWAQINSHAQCKLPTPRGENRKIPEEKEIEQQTNKLRKWQQLQSK
jgi:hypothetical protein